MDTDLFGNELPSTEKTFKQEYDEYINSAAWDRKRKEKMRQVGDCCEICGVSKYTKKLQVHHLTYKHFKNERMDELQVLCPECHEPADIKRKETVIDRRFDGPVYKGFEHWMDRGNDERWRRKKDSYLEGRWNVFLGRLGEKYANIPFVRNPDWN
jgi:hypothetical protein